MTCIGSQSKDADPKYRFDILIIDIATDEVVSTMHADVRRSAERIERGANINLDHMHYHTEIIDHG